MNNASLCDSCHKRPKHANHRYCGKTCAAAAQVAAPARRKAHAQGQGHASGQPTAKSRNAGANAAGNQTQSPAQLCKACKKKPAFGGFDYCGKYCASQAGKAASQPAQAKPRNAPSATPAKAPSKPSGGKNTSVPAPASAPAQKQHGNVHQAPAQAHPDTDSDDDYLDAYPDSDSDLDAYPSGSESEPDDSDPPTPVMPTLPSAQHSGSGKKASAQAGHGASHQTKQAGAGAAQVGQCLIPRCGNAPYVDSKSGVASDFCSSRHREEAVSIGQADGCIMCRKFPQGSNDYFCSRACREQALKKP
ncbi:hypothetical protein CONPUDRAFT_166738 [Coniophora puteana RWD-64-598 SS2]|uniref:Uncharacterized protein n=1 Tax=Coniophora puteana (strain RWD-64-598) TaxID=741705 RepID=A0A5M3MI08_CONPW|nr:uncharacterized protein CONPUDRAFT_166738 [Coniophora puteana RWD-64-598 SS2]EIW78842.1 hypothetical protein CONPUDRAFT_166738 [Coniophora puteana RWD-64-598 SS2]